MTTAGLVVRRRSWLFRLACGATLVAGAAVTPTAAAPRSGPSHKPPVLRLKFHRTGAAASVFGNSRFVFTGSQDATSLGTLIDTRTGARRSLSRRGCRDSPQSRLDGPWLVFDCSDGHGAAPELYALATGAWRSVTPNQEILKLCPVGTCDVSFVPLDAGTHWLEYLQSDCPLGEHCSSSYVFQNLHTGELHSDPSSGRTLADVNSPSLTRTLCAPLRVPRSFQLFSGWGPGTLAFDGRFAVAESTDMNEASSVYLERCGSSLHDLLIRQGSAAVAPAPVAADAKGVLWETAANRLAGQFLPSLHRFVIRLPLAAGYTGCTYPGFGGCPSQIALTYRKLYIRSWNNQLWTANAPTPPRGR